jgi:hypothetical protein
MGLEDAPLDPDEGEQRVVVVQALGGVSGELKPARAIQFEDVAGARVKSHPRPQVVERSVAPITDSPGESGKCCRIDKQVS